MQPAGAGPSLSQTLKSGNIRATWNLMSDNLRKTEETLSESDRLLGQLIELGRLPQHEKQAAVLFIPRGQGMWTHFGLDKEWGIRASFIPVGISGLALLDGMLGSTDGSRPFHYGLDGYGEPRFSDGFTDESLLARTRELGFSRLFILQPDSSGHWHRRVIGD